MADSDILIVEDNAVNILILRAMLRKAGFDSMVATDGTEGVEMAVARRPRLVLMDLHMPRLDGFAAAAEIIRRMAPDAPRIVAVTANVTDEVVETCRTAGFAEVLGKPLDLDALIALVERQLGPR